MPTSALHASELYTIGSELVRSAVSILAREVERLPVDVGAPRSSAATAAYEPQVPLLRCDAPVAAGTAASATIRVSNDESSATVVALYASNFIADSGYEIAALQVGFAPRALTIEAGSSAAFTATITLGMQTPPGLYSGLVQATGCKYVKAVLMLEVI
jgi:hypothetical protein